MSSSTSSSSPPPTTTTTTQQRNTDIMSASPVGTVPTIGMNGGGFLIGGIPSRPSSAPPVPITASRNVSFAENPVSVIVVRTPPSAIGSSMGTATSTELVPPPTELLQVNAPVAIPPTARVLSPLTTTTIATHGASSPTDHHPPDATSPVLEFNSLQSSIQRSFATGITYSEARGELYKHFLHGGLMKRGFRHRRLWKARWVVLSGRNLFYADGPLSAHDKKFIGSCELMGTCVVEVPPINTENSTRPDQQFDFHVFPRGTQPSLESSLACSSPFHRGPSNQGEVWLLRARNAKERDEWVRSIRRAVQLIQRTEMAPTLTGVGPVTDHFNIGKHLGNNIYCCVAKATNREFRVRVVHMAVPVQEQSKINAELRVLKTIMKTPPPYVLRTIQLYDAGDRKYLISERVMGPTLDTVFVVHHTLSVNMIQRMIFQLSSALCEIHTRCAVIVNIRPNNIVFENESTFKLTDFSKAVMLPVTHDFVTSHSYVGIPNDTFTAPEVLLHHQFSRACDVWGVGCVALFAAMNGHMPDRHVVDRLDGAMVGDDALALVLRSMLRYERTRRVTFAGLLEHEWVKQAKTELIAVRLRERKMAFKRLRTVSVMLIFVSRLRKLWLAHKRKGMITDVESISTSSPPTTLRGAPPRTPPKQLQTTDIATSCSVTSGLSGARSSGSLNALVTSQQQQHQQQQQPLSPIEARNLLFAPDANAAFSRNASSSGGVTAYPPSNDRFKSLNHGGSGIGIMSSVAGQLSELGSVDSKLATGADAPVKPPGPFLAALEHELHEDFTDEDGDDERDNMDDDTETSGGGGGMDGVISPAPPPPPQPQPPSLQQRVIVAAVM